ncbi:MAG: hypothetical protein EZS28_050105, partial [Streblomastix strix]
MTIFHQIAYNVKSFNLGDGETFGIKATITSDAATIYYYFLFDPLASEK